MANKKSESLLNFALLLVTSALDRGRGKAVTQHWETATWWNVHPDVMCCFVSLSLQMTRRQRMSAGWVITCGLGDCMFMWRCETDIQWAFIAQEPIEGKQVHEGSPSRCPLQFFSSSVPLLTSFIKAIAIVGFHLRKKNFCQNIVLNLPSSSLLGSLLTSGTWVWIAIRRNNRRPLIVFSHYSH